MDDLLEREAQLTALRGLLGDVAGGSGRLALVYGEAGIGKTALVRRFCADSTAHARVLWGTCDALLAPRPFAPLLEISRDLGGALAAEIDHDAKPYDVAVAFERELERGGPTIVVLDDMHLADEATLDVLRLLGRRVAAVPVLLVISHRDDVVDRFHPLRVVLGDVASATPVARVQPSRLSRTALVPLAAAHGVTVDELHRRTEGNPFFVTEVLASGDGEMPETVRDAVLARAARVDPEARLLLDVVAVTPPRCELWLLQALADDGAEALADALASGILVDDGRAVAFRHELARQAIEESIAPDRREALHRRTLDLLGDPPVGERDLARLAHHAEAVGDGDLVLEFAPPAARRAAELSAHREAATHYRRVLAFADRLDLEQRAALSVAAAHELHLIIDLDAARDAQRAAADCYAQLGDPVREGSARCALAEMLWLGGDVAAGLPEVQRALELLDAPRGPELVRARCAMARLLIECENVTGAQDWARLAKELADELGDDASSVIALETVGAAAYTAGDRAGLEQVEVALGAARRLGLKGVPVWQCLAIAHTAERNRDYDVAERYVQEGLEHCTLDDDNIWRYYLLSLRSKVLLARGDWSQAEHVAEICLGDPCVPARVHTLTTIGLTRARRGDPTAWEALDEALELATPRHEIQWTAVTATARAEAAWLEGRRDDAIAETGIAYTDGAGGTAWEAPLAYWRAQGGDDVVTPNVGETAFRLEIDGDWEAAQQRWRELGCPYEAARATLSSDDETVLRAALAEFERLGAAAAVKLAAARLYEIGARGVPRGPRITTRSNPAQLTDRELEVLELVADGLRNAEVAERLVVSERTVDHHVSAILRKLGVANRVQAAAEAVRLGIGVRAPSQR